jgi:hypothetical protein
MTYWRDLLAKTDRTWVFRASLSVWTPTPGGRFSMQLASTYKPPPASCQKNLHFSSRLKGGCYMAPIWFPLILYLIIDIHVFLVIVLFSCIYMNSSNSAFYFWDRIFCWLHSQFPLSPRYMRCCTRMFLLYIYKQSLNDSGNILHTYCPRPTALSMLSGLACLRKKRRSNMDFW